MSKQDLDKDLDIAGNWYTKMRCGIERKIVKR